MAPAISDLAFSRGFYCREGDLILSSQNIGGKKEVRGGGGGDKEGNSRIFKRDQLALHVVAGAIKYCIRHPSQLSEALGHHRTFKSLNMFCDYIVTLDEFCEAWSSFSSTEIELPLAVWQNY